MTLSASDLRALMSYDEKTGVFSFRNDQKAIKAGQPAGRIKENGYRTIKLKGRAYYAHRLAWLYVHGEWPAGEVDHINRNKDDNSLENLRVATSRQNKVNRAYKNKCGLRGVHKLWNKYHATIRVAGKSTYLGSYDTAEEAHVAYCEASRRLHGEYATPLEIVK